LPIKSILPSAITSTHKNQPVLVAPSDIAIDPSQSPIQPILQYPVTIFGGKRRSFNPVWYKNTSGLNIQEKRMLYIAFFIAFLVHVVV